MSDRSPVEGMAAASAGWRRWRPYPFEIAAWASLAYWAAWRFDPETTGPAEPEAEPGPVAESRTSSPSGLGQASGVSE